MSTKQERLAKYTEALDSYILHQMSRKTEVERQLFREKILRQYDDRFERRIEAFKNALEVKGK